MTCPRCFKHIDERFCYLPGDCLLCEACGEFLTVTDSGLAPATPEQLTDLTKIRLKVLLGKKCAKLKTICGRLSPANQ